ncbi:hypothetical protein NP233_g719 [Leucocoprinus birnbaumii]|uniref:Uncharacterized protein n=1 Tax=Leucocoprinus birnbaumii TaxID=56174 RepID=A0AAD5Z049_9AGAR|nr:hypothetical protein NP233_g719 [Leucocoprinus birnbaumii]
MGEEGGKAVVLSEARKERRKRKKRVSDVFSEGRTDEEIAKRFKENREENRTLWAQGSYLQIIKAYIHSLHRSLALSRSHSHSYSTSNASSEERKPWNVWLSLNPESDSSAIWLERKFDVPKSGIWANENVFEIPIFHPSHSHSSVNGKGKAKEEGSEQGRYTGLIVFECTPTDGVGDDIEKYVFSLFLGRITSLQWSFLNWGNQKVDDEFLNMVKKYVEEEVFAGYATMGITTTMNLDEVLSGVLRSVKLDVEGRLVRSLTIRGIFRTFEEEFSNFLVEWLDNCSANGYFDWTLYGQLVQATIGLLNKMGSLVSAMMSKSKRDLLSSFDVNAVSSSDTAYETAFTWLSRINDRGDTEKIAVDLQSHININQDFPARTFIQHLLELTVLRTEKHTNVASAQTKQDIPIVDLKAAEELFEAAIPTYQTQLNLALNMSVRRSPKRRGMSEETEGASPEAKRLKLATSFATSAAAFTQDIISPPGTPPPYLNGKTHSPSPSIVSNTSIALTETTTGAGSVTSESSPSKQVTVAMLRALTKDMRKKYGSGSGKALQVGSAPSTPASYFTRS